MIQAARMRSAAIALVAAALCSAQTPLTPPANEIVANFRAYRAALEAGDLAAADVSGAAALAASAARDGDGGRTGILALNLANVRLERGMWREAEAPARQALRIAEQSASAGVDPLIARLAIGRIEINADAEGAGERLAAALQNSEGRDDLAEYAYPAALTLGDWASRERRRLDFAVAGWRAAVEHAVGARGDSQVARASALSTLGATLVVRVLFAAPGRDGNRDDIRLAIASLADAREIIRPIMEREANTDAALTPAQRVHANTLAWLGFIRAYGQSDMRADWRGLDLPGLTSVTCGYQLNMLTRPRYPYPAYSDLPVGTAVVRLRLDERGQVLGRSVVAGVPDEHFTDAVSRVVDSWSITRDVALSNQPCRDRNVFVTVVFALRD
ncbi:MAG: hypothetical protein AB7T08_00295 [Hyphomonadaceae bacterium]